VSERESTVNEELHGLSNALRSGGMTLDEYRQARRRLILAAFGADTTQPRRLAPARGRADDTSRQPTVAKGPQPGWRRAAPALPWKQLLVFLGIGLALLLLVWRFLLTA
jgi:hypothetical protein